MGLQRITFNTPQPLYSAAATRQVEHAAMRALPPHTLMQRAGLSVARLVCAIAPHARVIWMACGPGNNGGDGLEAAMHLRCWGREPVVTWLGDEADSSPDALASLERARQAGVWFANQPPARWDAAVDALLGIGASRAPHGVMLQWLNAMRSSQAPVLCVDIPSGLAADTGCWPDAPENSIGSSNTIETIANYPINTGAKCQFGSQNHTLSLLTLKPGLFTAQGRDACGSIWWDDLDVFHDDSKPTAWLAGRSDVASAARAHASHKGSFGDVAVIGGAAGMQGAALLAARTALHAGAGRVFVGLLDGAAMPVDAQKPELMMRDAQTLPLEQMTVVCGCGGGDAVRRHLPRILSVAPRLVLDADALNAVASDTALQSLLTHRAGKGQATVLTPHPLEAARLLGSNTAQVQANRLQAAQSLADRFQATVILKGSGSVIASHGEVPALNPTGNARLATAGTGDVLAGLCGARLAQSEQTAHQAAVSSCFAHGELADRWPAETTLTASALAASLRTSIIV